jgi:hypothetical protein
VLQQSFEELLLQKVHQSKKESNEPPNKKRVAVEAEGLTQPEDLRRLKEMEKQARKAKKQKDKNKKPNYNLKNVTKTKNAKKKRRLDSSTSEESED